MKALSLKSFGRNKSVSGGGGGGFEFGIIHLEQFCLKKEKWYVSIERCLISIVRFLSFYSVPANELFAYKVPSKFSRWTKYSRYLSIDFDYNETDVMCGKIVFKNN